MEGVVLRQQSYAYRHEDCDARKDFDLGTFEKNYVFVLPYTIICDLRSFALINFGLVVSEKYFVV